MKYVKNLLMIIMPVIISGCKITNITQPVSADTNSEIVVNINVTASDVPETNPHKGLIGILLPQDWEVIGGTYSCSLGSGSLLINDEWKDSLEACYPSNSFEGNMNWICLVSDNGYTYTNAVDVDIELRLRTGMTEGCFKLGYLVSKATSGLICSGQSSWAPFSYPNNISVPNGTTCEDKFKVEKADEWDSLFNRKSGWTGADGIYSIPMDESEKPGGQDHLILFSDTFIGNVDASGKRINTTIVNNTLAYLKGNQPVEDSITFMWNQNGSSPKAVFVPATSSATANDFYWLMDGIKIGDTIHVFSLRLKITGNGAFDFEINGTVIISFTLSDNYYPENITQTDFPFFLTDSNNTTILGQAILPNTEVSGNKNYDGYIYVYGPRDSSNGKKLIASRVLPEEFMEFDKWQFWNGNEWTNDFSSCASITDQISQEFSITEIDDKYLLVCQIGSSVAVRFGESPVGPFDFYNEIYQCPEVQISSNVFVYNAKAHPSLSDDNSLLISYNVNTLSFSENINIADIYRPRFIKLSINENQTGIKEKTELPAAYRLLQNYPNPFNPVTLIEFELGMTSEVSLKIYNSLGEVVKTLIDSKTLLAGRYKTSWEPHNLSSGVYFYSLETSGKRETKKMVFIK